MDLSNLNLCVICCSAFSSASTVKSDAALCREHLVSFCKLLANSPPRQPDQFDALLQKSFPGMDVFFEESGMSVCVECHHQLTVAMEKGKEAERREEEVRKLQLQILQQMKELQKQVDDFHEEMAKVEKVIQTSDVSCLMYHMAKHPSKNEDATNGIVLIRDRIVDVMTDLRQFQVQQSDILNFDLEELDKLANVHWPMIIFNEGDEYGVYIPEPDFIVGTEGLMEVVDLPPMFFGHTIFTNQGDFRFDPSVKLVGDSDFSADDHDEAGSSDSDVEVVTFEQKQHAYLKQVSAQHNNIGNDKNSKSQLQSSRGQVVGDVQSGFNSASSSVLSTQFTLKKEIVDRSLQRQRTRKPEDDKSLDPVIRHQVMYNPTSDKLTLSNFEILVDEGSRSLKCVTCGFFSRQNRRGGGSLDLEWKMKVHIIGVHVGFKCIAPGCTVQCPDHQNFLKHLKFSHGGNPNNNGVSNNNEQQLQAKQHQKPAKSIIGTRSSPRQAPTTTTPTPLPQKTLSNSIRSHNYSASVQQRQPSSHIRTCPVSICRKTFTKKDEFIKHLQGHRQQNKMQRQQQQRTKMEQKNIDNVEPELVILD